MKNKKIIFRRLITALLCGAMIISLGGCDINQIIGDAVSNALNSAVDEYYGSGNGNGNGGSSSNFQGDNDANGVRSEVSEALSAIRTVIKLSDAFCGVAYLGYTENPIAKEDFRAWLIGTNPRQLEDNPFIADIPEENIIGDCGQLFCLIPRDENASVAVNSIHWDSSQERYVEDEVLYRSESGQPILIFSKPDPEYSYASTNNVFVVNDDGSTVEWYPGINPSGYIYVTHENDMAEDSPVLTMDFTNYDDFGIDGLYYYSHEMGWSGPRVVTLAGDARVGDMYWHCTAADPNEKIVHYTFIFHNEGDNRGTAILGFAYDDSSEFEEVWNGYWHLEEVPEAASRLELSMNSASGKYFADYFRILVSPSGEQMVMSRGEHGTLLPEMSATFEYFYFDLVIA